MNNDIINNSDGFEVKYEGSSSNIKINNCKFNEYKNEDGYSSEINLHDCTCNGRNLNVNIPTTHKCNDKENLEKKGIKYDYDKFDWNLIPIDIIEEVVEILDFGAKKYSPYNWKYVKNPYERYYSALMRHIVAWKKGEKIDQDSGKSHLAHAICNLIFLRSFDKSKERLEKEKSTKIKDFLNSLKGKNKI